MENNAEHKNKIKGIFSRLSGLSDKERKLFIRLGVILLIGIVLMNFTSIGDDKSDNNSKTTESSTNQKVADTQEEQLETKLATILSTIKGAGEVRVAVRFSESESTQYLQDSESTSNSTQEVTADSNTQSKETTKSEQLASANDQPVEVKTVMPQIAGVLVVAEGADNAVICEQLSKAVQQLLGISAYQVEVLPAQ